MSRHRTGRSVPDTIALVHLRDPEIFVRLHGQRVVIECKNTTRTDLAGWMSEAEDERGNDDALVGLVVHKRHGKGDPLDQWVHMTVRELVAILAGQRVEDQ